MNIVTAARRILLVVPVLLGVGVQQAAADPIGPTCLPEESCQGGIYTLERFLLTDNAVNDLYAIRLTMNLSGLSTSPTPAVAVDSVAVKTTSQNAHWVGGFTLFSAPGGPASWSRLDGGIDADGCSGNGGGFFCEDWIGAGVGAATGPGNLVFVWTGLVNPANLLLTTSSIKARFVDSSGGKTGALFSENIELQAGPPGVDPRVIVPEPVTLLLLGPGLFGATLYRAVKARNLRKRAV